MLKQELVNNFISNYPGNRACFILGSTGETGRRLVRQIILSGAFSTVKVVARRPLVGEFMPTPPEGVNVEQVIVADFTAIAEDSTMLADCEFGFCALGTTKKKVGGAEEFVKIDHDLTLKMLRLAKDSGCKYLALVSAMGASPASPFLYAQTKGRLEASATALNFPALRIYRPGMLQVKRQEERRPLEKLALLLAPVLNFCTTGRFAVEADVLAEAMLVDALKFGAAGSAAAANEPKLSVFSNKQIKQHVQLEREATAHNESAAAQF